MHSKDDYKECSGHYWINLKNKNFKVSVRTKYAIKNSKNPLRLLQQDIKKTHHIKMPMHYSLYSESNNII